MKKNNFKADMILNKKFSNELSGYNATEVDEFFDKVIEDYRLMEERIDALEDVIEDKVQIISDKDNQIKKVGLENLNLKNQLVETEKATNFEMMKELKDLKEVIKNNKI